MQNQTFIHKYKPKYIDDFFINPDAKHILKSLLPIELKLLISGEPNSGKTSFLYAIVRDYYQEQPITEQDVLYINNLKEQQGISFFRNELKTFCKTRRATPLKKIIVIDDLDLIHQQCQQVLCNYMDKYQNNIHFLFSCSNWQKIIENIQSRVMMLNMENPKKEQLYDLYQRIVREEGMQDWFNVEEKDAIEKHILTICNDNFRDLMNIMEKLIVYRGNDTPNNSCSLVPEKITLDICKSLFLTRIYQSFYEYIRFLKAGMLKEAIEVMNSIVYNGYSVVDIFDYFFKFIKQHQETTAEVFITETEKYEIIQLLCRYITIIHTVHEETIELILFTNQLWRNLLLKTT